MRSDFQKCNSVLWSSGSLIQTKSHVIIHVSPSSGLPTITPPPPFCPFMFSVFPRLSFLSVLSLFLSVCSFLYISCTSLLLAPAPFNPHCCVSHFYCHPCPSILSALSFIHVLVAFSPLFFLPLLYCLSLLPFCSFCHPFPF